MQKPAVVLKTNPKKRRKNRPRHVLVASGIYRHVQEKTYHERPKINGKRTWRSLGVNFTPQRNFKAAEDEYTYCKRRGVVRVNPVADRPKYQPSSKVRHCREFCPRDADELHTAGACLFGHPNSIALGFQLFAEAYSGLRTSEVLEWGRDV